MLQADGFNNSNVLADSDFHGGDSEDFYIDIGSMFAILAEPDQPDHQPANLSDTSSEAVPPDGVLGVPLLKHRRIASSWMVQKEANGLHCSRGILADDQTLGKTVSTIALVLSEKSPSSKFSPTSANRG